MLGLLEELAGYVSIPTWLIIALLLIFLIMQVIGEIIEFFGKVAPGFMKVRKTFQEKREKEKAAEERAKLAEERLAAATAALEKNNKLFENFDAHYNTDNITKRDCWMHDVDEDRTHMHALESLLQTVRDDVLNMRIEAMRSEIINFTPRATNDSYLATREEYRRIFRLYDDYEKVLSENKMENGEIDTNYRVIKESYEKRLVNHAFLEDVRGF